MTTVINSLPTVLQLSTAEITDLKSRVKKLEDKVFGPVVIPPPTNPGEFIDKYGVKHAYQPKGTVYYTVDRTMSGSDSIRDNIETAVPLINAEVTGYFKAAKSPSNSGVQLKLRGGQHSTTESRKYEGSCYAPAIRLNTGVPHLRYENPHPDYHRITVSPLKTFGNLAGKWFGFRGVINTTPEGWVRIQQWIDPVLTSSIAAPQNSWIKTLDYIDKVYKQLKNKGPTFKTTFRLDDSALESKWLNAYEIVI